MAFSEGDDTGSRYVTSYLRSLSQEEGYKKPPNMKTNRHTDPVAPVYPLPSG